MPYPDDLDDTCCAMAAISLFRPEALSGGALASLAKLFEVAEHAVGGPYNTWLIPTKPGPDSPWRDADPAVNANIAFFLGLSDVELPAVMEYIEDTIIGGRYISKYYPPLAVMHFAAKSYRGKLHGKLKSDILSQKKSSGWQHPLAAALAMSSLLRLGAPSSKVRKEAIALMRLADTHQWESHGMYAEDPATGRESSGSPALTAACAAEALALYKEALVREAQEPLREQKEKMAKAVEARVRSRFAKSSPHAKAGIEKILRKIQKRDAHEQVLLLPYNFARSLHPSSAAKVPERVLVELGAANAFGWIAYTIFDDILDNEGMPELLPLASVCLREVVEIYLEHMPQEEQPLFREIMDGIDQANEWERVNCYRVPISPNDLPSYKNYAALAEKSLGHALGPLAVLFRLGYASDSSDGTALLAFFRHYLIARQLNDDAHDWLSDLKRGFLNSVSVNVLAEWKKAHDREFSLETEEKSLQTIFNESVILKAIDAIDSHCKKARTAVGKVKILAESDYLIALVASLEKASALARRERDLAIEFLKSY